MSETSRAPSRLMAEMTKLASDMRANSTMDQATFEKITMRHIGQAELAAFVPSSAADIRAIREEAHMSQAVFAKHLNLTVGYISHLEKGTKSATGASLALLTILQRKGFEALS